MPTFSKNARYISSITNIANCGGNKKAGLGTTIGKRSFMIRRTRQNNIYPKTKGLSNIWELFGNNPELLEGVNNGNQAGSSVALSSDGKTVAIGEPTFSVGVNTFKGRVRVFRLVNDRWTQVGTNTDALVGATASDLAGLSVALSSDGNTVAIGEPGFDDAKGRVRVFRLDGNDEWQLVDPVTALVGADFDYQAGISVALSNDGNTVAIGEIGFDGDSKGRVRVFRLDGNDTWQLVDTPLVGVNATDFAGDSVALSSDGNTVAIGEPGFNDGINTNAGRVRVFRLDIDDEWQSVGTNPIALVGANAGDDAGESVALSSDGNTVAIGEPGFNNGSDAGRVRVFRLVNNKWTQVGINPELLEGVNADDFAGGSVALSSDGNTVAIGEREFDGDKGRVRVFRLVNNRWTLIDTASALEGENANDEAGSSVALSSDGNTVAIGEPGFDSDNGTINNAGRVRVFTLSEEEVEEGKCPSAFSNYRPVLAGVGNMYRFKMY